MHLNWFWQFVGWLPLPLLVVLTGVVLWRKAYRQFPLFVLYVALSTAVTIARLFVYRIGYIAYFYFYWISDLLLLLTAFVVIYDLFARKLFAGFYKVRFYRRWFPVLVAATFVLAVFTATTALNKKEWFLIASRTLNFVQVAFLVFFGGLMIVLERDWSRYELGISLGFAIKACVTLIVAALQVRLHYRVTLVDQVPALAYDLSCLIWIVSCWSGPDKSRPRPAPLPVKPEWLEEARRLERQLKNWISKRRCL